MSWHRPEDRAPAEGADVVAEFVVPPRGLHLCWFGETHPGCNPVYRIIHGGPIRLPEEVLRWRPVMVARC